MKKYTLAAASLLFVFCAARASLAASLKSFGVCAEVPEGWKVTQGEQVLIYNGNESAAVIIDEVTKNEGENAESVASSLAEAVGVKKQDIRRDSTGAISMEFVQNSEPVNVRVIDEKSRVLMVYSFGRDAEAERVARSVVRSAEEARADTEAGKPVEEDAVPQK